MALDDDIRALARVDLFSEFSEEQLRLLAFGAETMRLPAGRDLYREGHLADSAFVITRGRVELHRERDGGRETVSIVSEGTILGEFSLISETRRVTGATAVTDCDVIRLNRKLFRRILEEYPDSAAALLRKVTRNFQDMVERIEKLDAVFGRNP